MCGFFAVISPRGLGPEPQAIRRALDSLGSRGPDGEGLYRQSIGDVDVVMGHRRLAIVDIEGGGQPLVEEHCLAVVNGELYGHQHMRERMQAGGTPLAQGSDSRMVTGLYGALTHNTRAAPATPPRGWLDALCGEWAFALVDRRDGTLWAACDPWGTKPLRWWRSRDGRTTIVASEAKALFALGVLPELDLDAVRTAMAVQYPPYGQTLFKGVGMLPPASWLRVGRDGISTGRTWDHFVQRPRVEHAAHTHAAQAGAGLALDQDFAQGFSWLSNREVDAVRTALAPGAHRGQHAHALRLLLEGAVARRLPTERDFCTHLSGGIDSAIVAALATRLSGRTLDTYCASFSWAGLGDETMDARASAVSIGARFHAIHISPAALLEGLDRGVVHSEGLANNAHLGAKVVLTDTIRGAGYRVVMTGEGADEAFLGYEHFRDDFAPGARPTHGDVNPLSLGILRPEGGSGADMGNIAALLGSVPSWIATKAAAGLTMQGLLGPRLQAQGFDIDRMVTAMPADVVANAGQVDAVERARAMWSIYPLSSYILRGLDDAAGMSCGVESRLAFLDPAIAWFAARLPPSSHYGEDGLEKGLLRLAMDDVLPTHVLARPKRAFLAPSPLEDVVGRTWARDRLLDGRLATSALFDGAGLARLLDAPSRPVRDSAIVTLASLASLMESFAL